MYRTIALLVAFLTLSATGAATWFALQPPIGSMIVPGAADVQVVATGWGQWQITYHAPGVPYAWYYATAHRLEAGGWITLDSWRPTGSGSIFTPIVPLRFQQLYILLQDQVILVPNARSPNVARIQVRRWLALPWRNWN